MTHDHIDEWIEPLPLARARRRIRELIPEATDGFDRRGFRLLEWPASSGDPQPGGKPLQLSLEHEARLMPADDSATVRLLTDLSISEGRPLADHLLPGKSEFADLVIRDYQRGPGAQSADRYFDRAHAPVGGMIERGLTVRQRLKTADFMTWHGGEGIRPINAELRCVQLGESGLIARLEFNWNADLARCLEEALTFTDDRILRRNPLWLLGELSELSLGPLLPVIDHVTVRRKFGLHDRSHGASGEDPIESSEVMVINVDLIRVTRSDDQRVAGVYADVDISSVLPVDAKELGRLERFAAALSRQCALIPGDCTKALRGARVLGLLT